MSDGLQYPQWWRPAPFSSCQVVLRRDPERLMLHRHFLHPPNPPRVSLPFFQRNGANVQPCGQLTGRPGPYANLMTAETIVSSARCKKCVVRRCTYSNPDLC